MPNPTRSLRAVPLILIWKTCLWSVADSLNQWRRLPEPQTGLWLAGNEGMEKKMEAIIMGYIGTT